MSEEAIVCIGRLGISLSGNRAAVATRGETAESGSSRSSFECTVASDLFKKSTSLQRSSSSPLILDNCCICGQSQ